MAISRLIRQAAASASMYQGSPVTTERTSISGHAGAETIRNGHWFRFSNPSDLNPGKQVAADGEQNARDRHQNDHIERGSKVSPPDQSCSQRVDSIRKRI